MAHFLQGITETQLDHFLGVGGAICQAFTQFVFTRRHDKEIHQTGGNERVIAGSHLSCALHIDVQDHVLAALQELKNLGFQSSIKISVDLGVLEEISSLYVGFKLLPVQEVVITGVDLTLPDWTRSAGNRVVSFPVPGQSSAECRLAGPGGSGDEEENARSLGHGDSLRENARGCKSSDGAAGIWRIYDRPAVQVVACFRKSTGMPGPEGEGEGLEGLPALCYGESMSTANDSGSCPRSGCVPGGCRAPGCQKIAHRMR